MTRSWLKHLVFTVVAVVCSLAAASPAVAQDKKYKAGDRVECDWLQNGTFDKGTVVPFTSTDLDQSGRWYRVKLDKDKIPNSTVECMATRLRPFVEEAKDDSQNNAGGGESDQNQSNTNNDSGDGPSPKNRAAKYEPGDRVECDKAQIGVWEKGTVMHYLPNDTDRGSYVRVKLDGYKLYPEGLQCLANFIRPLGGEGLKATGKYKVGDAVEAKNHNGSWLPAKITAVDGAFYKVRFENRDSRYDETIDEERIRPPGASEKEAADQNEGNEARDQNPRTGRAPRSLPGTAWKIDFGKGVRGTIFRFCKSGTWDIVPDRAGSIGAVGKSYSVSGNTLTTVNRDDGKVQRWKMTWEGDVLVLFDGKQTLRLHYNGQTQC
jgi:hypothetical protein